MLYLVNPRRKHRRVVHRRRVHRHNPKKAKAQMKASSTRTHRRAYRRKTARPLLHEVAPNVFKRGARSKAMFPEVRLENPRRHRRHRRNPDIVSDLKGAVINGAVGAGTIMTLNWVSNEVNSLLKTSTPNMANGVKLLIGALVPELLKKQIGAYAKVAQDVAVAYTLYEIIKSFLPDTVQAKVSRPVGVLKPSTVSSSVQINAGHALGKFLPQGQEVVIDRSLN